jgi:hypothetical protein
VLANIVSRRLIPLRFLSMCVSFLRRQRLARFVTSVEPATSASIPQRRNVE